MLIEVALAAQDPQPQGWDAFVARAGLTAVWRYDLLALASQDSWCPAVVALARHSAGNAVAGVLVAVQRTVHPRLRPRRGLPLLLDVRMPGQAYRESWQLDPSLDRSARQELLAALLRAAVARLDPLVVGTAYRTVTDTGLTDLPHRSQLTRPTLPGSVLPVPATVEDWLGSLRRKRAGSLRRRGAVLEQRLDVRVGRARTDVDVPALARLVREQTARYGSRVDPRPAPGPAYLQRLVSAEDVLTLTYQEPDGRLVAAGIALDSPTELVSAIWAAVPPAEGGPKDVYFDQYLRWVRAATDLGRPVIRAGRGFAELKSDVGFAAEPLWFVASARLPGPSRPPRR